MKKFRVTEIRLDFYGKPFEVHTDIYSESKNYLIEAINNSKPGMVKNKNFTIKEINSGVENDANNI